MASEWEELEKLSKGELIIELVHWKNMYGILRVEQDSDCPWPYAEPMSRICEDGWLKAGHPTTDRWAEAIAKHAMAHSEDGDFDPVDLMDYGTDEDQAIEVCRKICPDKFR